MMGNGLGLGCLFIYFFWDVLLFQLVDGLLEIVGKTYC